MRTKFLHVDAQNLVFTYQSSYYKLLRMKFGILNTEFNIINRLLPVRIYLKENSFRCTNQKFRRAAKGKPS